MSASGRGCLRRACKFQFKIATERTSRGKVHMSSLKFWAVIVVLGLLVVMPAPLARAQSTYGTVDGTVLDSSGAAVAGAQVTLTNVGTQEKRVQNTENEGLYKFVNLPPGEYRIDIEKGGFKHFTRTNVEVQVQQDTHIDASLQVGQVSES